MIFNILKNKKNYKKTREKSRGRSMVEMLGVLAIIGVLSIGGIQGYTIAMRRFRANEILNVANKYALIMYEDIQNKMMNQPNEWYIDEDGRWMYHGSPFDYNDLLSFRNAGLGGLPSHVSNISLHKIVTNESGDLVVMLVHFDDKDEQLCQTVFQISGTVPLSATSFAQCEKDEASGIAATVTFIMN